VPHGGFGVKGGWKQGVLNAVGRRFVASGLVDRLAAIEAKYPKIAGANHVVHLGTLGTDNHFIEVCDGDLRVWMMLHCGSRSVGNRIGTQFIDAAREALLRREGAASVPDRDLAWFEEGAALSHDCRNIPGNSWNGDRRERERSAVPFHAAPERGNCHTWSRRMALFLG